MPLLTELEFLAFSVLQRCQPYGLSRSRQCKHQRATFTPVQCVRQSKTNFLAGSCLSKSQPPNSPIPTLRTGSPPPASWTAEIFTQRTKPKTVRFPIVQHPGCRRDDIRLNKMDWNRSRLLAFSGIIIFHECSCVDASFVDAPIPLRRHSRHRAVTGIFPPDQPTL